MRGWLFSRAAIYAAIPVLVIALTFAGVAFTDPGLEQDAEAFCASQVISDWSADGKVDDRYELRCYRAAIHRLPDDLRAYSSAEDEIGYAMQLAAAQPR